MNQFLQVYNKHSNISMNEVCNNKLCNIKQILYQPSQKYHKFVFINKMLKNEKVKFNCKLNKFELSYLP